MSFSESNKLEDLENSDLIQQPFGYGLHHIICHFNDSFNQSGKKLFDNFINEFGEVKKWILSSDYAFNDKNKKNDVVTFSLFPCLENIDEMSDHIKKMAPADIKKSKSVSKEFITFLSSGNVFNISFVIDRDRRMHSNETDYHLYRFDGLINLLKYWCESTPEGKIAYQKSIKKLEQAKKLITSPGVNLKIFRDIDIIASLAAFLLAEVSKTADLENILWLSDRDSMLFFKKKLIGEFLLIQVGYLYHILCSNNNVESKNKLILISSESKWLKIYDSFVRVPDYIAGALADFDFDKNKTSHEKFEIIKNGTFGADSRNISYKLSFKPNIRAGRMVWGVEDN